MTYKNTLLLCAADYYKTAISEGVFGRYVGSIALALCAIYYGIRSTCAPVGSGNECGKDGCACDKDTQGVGCGSGVGMVVDLPNVNPELASYLNKAFTKRVPN